MQLVEEGKAYFLESPAPFWQKPVSGHAAWPCSPGMRALFTGLAAEHRWDWSRRYPVIRISFSDGVLRDRAELEQRIRDILRTNRERRRACSARPICPSTTRQAA